MLRTVNRSPESAEAPDQDSPNTDEIRQHLRVILDSPPFHGSKRCQQFLEFVCQKAIAGEGASLKERTIAVEVFGRRPQADLGEDTIVRVSARELRKRLTQYYATPEGSIADIHIDLPSGSYVPEFRRVKAKVQEELPAPVALPATAPLRPRFSWRYRALGLVVAAIVLAVVKWTPSSSADKAFNLFWEPVFRTSEPLLMAVGHPIIYLPSKRAHMLSEDRLPLQAIPGQRILQLAPKEMDGSDMVPVLNQFVGFGDMIVATKVAAMLAQQKKEVRIRLASSLAFADLRQAQTILVGAVTNRWTMELGQGWRFQFRTSSNRSLAIQDTAEKDGAKMWGIQSKEDGSVSEDYILLCRIRNSTAGGMQIVAAGVKQFGTEAAGRLLTDSAQFGALLSQLPAGWEAKNLQIVLHVRVIGNTPAQPELVAWHVW